MFSIQAQYGSTWAPAHGANGGFYGSPQTVTLQAGESITAATLASLSAPGVATCVCYLKFETNQGRTLGPFDCGCGAGSATRFDLGDGLAYLSGNSGNSLDAIVLNYLPACVASELFITACSVD